LIDAHEEKAQFVCSINENLIFRRINTTKIETWKCIRRFVMKFDCSPENKSSYHAIKNFKTMLPEEETYYDNPPG
jgi:hypothetical protein